MKARFRNHPFLRSGWLLVFGLAFTSAGAETPPAPDCAGRAIQARVFTLRYRPVAEGAQLIDQLLGPCGSYKVPKSLRLVSVEDEPERLARIAEALASWDLPPRTVEITVSLILASRDPAPPGGLAQEIRGVSDTLSQITRWTRFDRIGSVTLRVAEGGEAEADLGEGFSVAFRLAGVDSERHVIQLEPFDLRRTPGNGEAGAGLGGPRTLLGGLTLNLLEGKLNLVGAPGRQQDRALFLALRAAGFPGGIAEE